MFVLRYIRHYHQNKRESSLTPDIFQTHYREGAYRDVVKLYENDVEDAYCYTVAKCLYPEGYQTEIVLQRWMLIYVVTNSLKVGDVWLSAGDFAFLPANRAHSLDSRKDQPVLYYWCTSNDALLQSVCRQCGFDQRDVTGHCRTDQRLISMFESLIYSPVPSPSPRIWFAGQLTTMLSFFAQTEDNRHTAVSPTRISRCISYIEQKGGNVTVQELSEHFYVSRRYLHILFMKETGMSPQKYIMKVKMQVADKYVTGSSYSITQIAEILQYSSYNHFSQAYKRYFGVLPREKRQNREMAKALDGDSSEPSEY